MMMSANQPMISETVFIPRWETLSIQFTEDNIDIVPEEYVLAAIAHHECFNLDTLERRYVMEAVWNRVQDNFNNNGTTLKEQILAPKQFTGLFKYYPEQFRFEGTNPLLVENVKIARDIIYKNNRSCPKRIYYWASKSQDSNTSHWRNIINNSLTKDHFGQIFK